MGMSKCYKFMKYLLIVCNIILLLVGLGVCGLAVWALCAGVAGAGADEAAGAGAGASAAAGLGALALWGGALGAGAAAGLAGSAGGPLLGAGVALSAMCAAAEGGAAWWGASHAPRLRRQLRAALQALLLDHYGRAPYPTQVIDAIQQGLECCGAESRHDWQRSAWSRAQAAPALAPAADPAADPATAPAPAARAVEVLDLTVGAPPEYYWVPASCCLTRDPVECELSRRVPAGAGQAGAGAAAGAALAGAACGARAVARLAALARAPLLAAAALGALHAAQLALALALALTAPPAARYKA